MPDVTSHTPAHADPPSGAPDALSSRAAAAAISEKASAANADPMAGTDAAVNTALNAAANVPNANGRGLETREHIKHVALGLFAERGVDGVSVRDLLAAAGQRSGGALHYHFGGKEGLLRELIADAAKLFDQARMAKLAVLKGRQAATGQAIGVRELLRVLADPFDSARETVIPKGYGALLNALQVEHYQAFTQGVEGLDLGYRECIQLLREAVPHLPRQHMNQRIRLMMLLLFSASAARERASSSPSGISSVWQRFWDEPDSRETLLDCLEGMLSTATQPSQSTP